MKTIALAATLLFAWQGVWAEEEPSIDKLWNDDTKQYEIKAPEDLITLANYVNAGNDCANLTFKVINEIEFDMNSIIFDLDEDDKNDSNYKPIGHRYEDVSGAANSFFCGTFDGNGKTISGIVVNDPDGFNVGLFGTIGGAEIKNVKLEDCTFSSNLYVGGIVGLSIDNSSISECTVGSRVTVNAVSCTINSEEMPGEFAGGIMGDCYLATISNCLCAATVKGDEYVGGIAGRLLSVKEEEGIIDECYFTGDVESKGENKGAIVGARGPLPEFEEADGSKGTLSFTLFNNDSEENIKNEDRIKMYDSQECNVTLSGRTLYKDNSWNTLCLPFDASLTDDFSGAEIRTLSSAEFMSGTLTLNFTPKEGDGAVTSIEAGKPYIIKWASGGEFTPTFKGVTIKSDAPSDATCDAANFHGIYTPYTTEGEDKSLLYLGANNTLYYPSAAMTINAFRAYFQLNNGITAGGETEEDPTNPETTSKTIRAFQLNLGDEETGIISVNESGLMVNESESWYSIDGRKLHNTPTAKGLYINKGKKILMK